MTTGDDRTSTNSSKLLLWSDDGGISWDKYDLALYWGDVSNPLNNAQGLSMYSTQHFLLMGGDDYQNCIYRVAKTHKEDTPVLEIVYKNNPLYNDRITQYTARWRRLSNGMIVVPLINGDHAPRRTRLLGTYDGLKWYELWSDIETMESLPANDGCLTEVDGYLYYQYRGYSPGTENIAFNYIKFKVDNIFI